MAVRKDYGYTISQVLCYTMISGMNFFWAVVKTILFYSGNTAITGGTAWQISLYKGLIVAGIFVYVRGFFFSLSLEVGPSASFLEGCFFLFGSGLDHLLEPPFVQYLAHESS